VNEGGPATLVRLATVPTLETRVPVGPEGAAALVRWQARPGEVVTVADPEGSFYRARLTEMAPSGAVVVPFSILRRPVESTLAIEVYQALPEKERFELVLQKATEIGATRIVPFVSRRSSTLEERDAGQKKSHRWPEVVLRAAKQCRRGIIPELGPVLTWDQATCAAASADLKLMLFEGEAPWAFREALRGETPARVALLVGPEGGFAPEEAEEAQGLGFLPVSIGPRILRTETAAIVGTALVQYALGDLG
jgi:16S rRNA (uracil1498-N3)-methyltransferase